MGSLFGDGMNSDCGENVGAALVKSVSVWCERDFAATHTTPRLLDSAAAAAAAAAGKAAEWRQNAPDRIPWALADGCCGQVASFPQNRRRSPLEAGGLARQLRPRLLIARSST